MVHLRFLEDTPEHARWSGNRVAELSCERCGVVQMVVSRTPFVIRKNGNEIRIFGNTRESAKTRGKALSKATAAAGVRRALQVCFVEAIGAEDGMRAPKGARPY